MFIKGKNTRNPVLLYLHGGIPDYFLTQRYPKGLDEHFTVVWWEQRGSGLSYRPDMAPQTVNPQQRVYWQASYALGLAAQIAFGLMPLIQMPQGKKS